MAPKVVDAMWLKSLPLFSQQRCVASDVTPLGPFHSASKRKKERERDLLVAGCSGLSVFGIKPSAQQLTSTVSECWHGDVCPWH